jgi:hypothetical protein
MASWVIGHIQFTGAVYLTATSGKSHEGERQFLPFRSSADEHPQISFPVAVPARSSEPRRLSYALPSIPMN